ncbi:TetR/AcrR family transcriptional regulator [Sphingomonas sp. CGMCC 1.13654]|uniref:TetR/AcrR family transcriptional regulator n=1 Tax=Sphingomonas chungangi TaxID=2683589 RepID=A0A838L150_9SPHN|nr:TetR/AcrR family transcriptional regulator [Sphingomonas chungangi]MBA2932670.1 TetR/AcrR family transcriptional regulator [Sphingomonas chungangi]
MRASTATNDDNEAGIPVPDNANRYERQKQRIVDAATILLNRKGMRGMTLADVAGELGLTTTSVTYYFRRKEQLVAAVFEDALARLAAMVHEAGREPTPRARVARYVELYFEDFAQARRERGRPIANLSEMRSMDGEARSRLIAQYRTIRRAVRGFFGPPTDEARKRLLTARAHILNEALFWQDTWLGQFAIGDLPNVRRRFFRILDGGITTAGTAWDARIIEPDAMTGPGEQESFLRVATRLINDTGYRGASVKRIMAELNRTKGSFYHHLDAKDDLIVSCWRISHRRLADLRAKAYGEHESPWRRISTTVTSALALQLANEFPLLRVTAYQAMPPAVRDLALLYAQRTALGVMGALVEAMAEGTVRPIDPLIASHLILSSINAAHDLQGGHEGQSIEEAIATYETVLGEGLFDPE